MTLRVGFSMIDHPPGLWIARRIAISLNQQAIAPRNKMP